MYKIDLNCNWKVRGEGLAWGPEMSYAVLAKEDEWMDAGLPCDIHMPLIENGVIKEPLEADHSFACEWIEEKSWWFKKTFDADQKLLDGDVVELTLESLDARADILLNGIHLAHHKSAHYPFTADVKELLKIGENVLLVRLSTGHEYTSEKELAALKKHVPITDNKRGDTRRAFVRKPQYVYGWDWGPKVATCGIMKNVWIESFNRLVIRSVRAFTKSVSGDADIGFEIEVENLHKYSTLDAEVEIEILDGDIKAASLRKSVFLRSGLNYVETEAVIKDARLWWPNGMGEQPLYTIKASILSKVARYEYTPFKFGIRTLKLDEEIIGEGERRFAFVINGIRVFSKGGNWIPADSIYARVTDENYDILIREAKEANFNMLRIWGGGIYERDIFYEKCDEYGIMIWHDFMFACALYPDNLEWFRNEVEKEADYQTRRLRNHSSIVLWSGNNENNWAFYEWWHMLPIPPFYGGAVCYNNILPRIVRLNCPDIPYWNGSPYGGEHPNGNDAGDRHHWHDCFFSDDMEKRITPEEYDKVSAKFVSEYGYLGPSRKSSILRYLGENPLDKNGKVWQLHTNTTENQTVAAGIAKHYIDPEKLDIDGYLLYAGLCQGLMYEYSLEAMRFKENCWGSLFWMYNDCWGEVGWTIIDYYLIRKIPYYFVKRAFSPVKLIMRELDGIVKVMGENQTEKQVNINVEYGYISLDGKDKDSKRSIVKLEPYSRKTVLEFEKGKHDYTNGLCYVKPETGAEDVLPAVLRSCAFKELNIPAAELKVSGFAAEENKVKFTVTSDVYAHAVHFNLDDSLRLSDEFFDLLPGESREITVYDVPDGFTLRDMQPRCITICRG